MSTTQHITAKPPARAIASAVDKPRAGGLFNQERWKPIPGYEGLYEASSEGQIRRASPYNNTTPSSIRKPYTDKDGYLRVTLCRRNKRETKSVHDLILSAFEGPRPSGLICRHLNDIPSDNRADNLKWGTYKENAEDRIRNGHATHGERNGSSRITETVVLQICDELKSGKSAAATARKLNLPLSTVYPIARCAGWKHTLSVRSLEVARAKAKASSTARKNMIRRPTTPRLAKAAARLFIEGVSIQGVADALKITRSSAAGICYGKTWRSLDPCRKIPTRSGFSERKRPTPITPAKVRVIRRCAEAGMLRREIAAVFGTYTSTVVRICRRETWKHVHHVGSLAA